MLRGLVGRAVEAAAEGRMALPGDHHQAFLADRPVGQLGLVEVQVVDRQVEFAAGQLRRDRGAFVGTYLQRHPRGQGLQAGHQARQQAQLGIVVHRQAKGPRSVRIEGFLGAKAGLQQMQGLAHRHVQGEGGGGGFQALGGAPEQRLVELFAQAGEGVAHRRLAAMQADRRARQVAFAHQGIEDQKQVEVELLQVQLHE